MQSFFFDIHDGHIKVFCARPEFLKVEESVRTHLTNWGVLDLMINLDIAASLQYIDVCLSFT